MIKLASPNGEGSPRDESWLTADRTRPGASLVVSRCRVVRNEDKSSGRSIDEVSKADANHSNQAASGQPVARGAVAFWRELVEGLFALVIMATVFCLSAWMLCHLTFDCASWGDFDVGNYLRRQF